MNVLSWIVSHTSTMCLSSGQYNKYTTVDVLNQKLFLYIAGGQEMERQVLADPVSSEDLTTNGKKAEERQTYHLVRALIISQRPVTTLSLRIFKKFEKSHKHLAIILYKRNQIRYASKIFWLYFYYSLFLALKTQLLLLFIYF